MCERAIFRSHTKNTFFEVITVKTDELIMALQKLKVQTGSLACLGCGHEHNCGVHGCAIAREAAVRLSLYEHALKQVTKERDAAVKQLRRMADCDTCKHDHPCGMDGDPCTACTTGQCWEWNGGAPCTF
jgi:hypothetical protein|nr:MAG TPA: hypothetical protein [Caudoviricetes sp.]